VVLGSSVTGAATAATLDEEAFAFEWIAELSDMPISFKKLSFAALIVLLTFSS
jgi:hypothetical protein